MPDYKVLKANIGRLSTIPGWPSNDISGLMQALQRWTLEPRLNHSGDDPEHPHSEHNKPFRCLAWGDCRKEYIPGTNMQRTRYVGTSPIYDGHPDAVSYCGNFIGYSFGFNVDTDDPALIAELDRLIALNIATPEYQRATQTESAWASRSTRSAHSARVGAEGDAEHPVLAPRG